MTRTYVSGTDIYPHMPIYVQTPCNFTNSTSLEWHLRWRICAVMFACGWVWPAHWTIHPILGAKFTKTVFGDCRISNADPISTRRVILISMWLRKQFSPWTLLPGRWPIRLILGIWGSKVPQNGTFPAQDAD